jgi:protein-S-isoprenylcysteine O-methyltransferase Ste14
MNFTEKIFPGILVFLQLSSLIFILISGSVFAETPEGIFMEMTGIFLGLLAIYTMKPGNFNIRPIIKQNGILITNGPYRIIRHPMYLAQIIAVIPLITEQFSYYRLFALCVLIIVLLIKINFEEKRLINHFSDYSEYMKTSKRLIPFIY